MTGQDVLIWLAIAGVILLAAGTALMVAGPLEQTGLQLGLSAAGLLILALTFLMVVVDRALVWVSSSPLTPWK